MSHVTGRESDVNRDLVVAYLPFSDDGFSGITALNSRSSVTAIFPPYSLQHTKSEGVRSATNVYYECSAPSPFYAQVYFDPDGKGLYVTDSRDSS